MAGLVPAIHVFDWTRALRRGCHPNSGLPEFGINRRRKSGKPDLR